MNVSEAIDRRFSVRAFRSDPVPQSVVAEILERASRAPSGGNLQPWRVYVLAADTLTRFKSIVAAAADESPEYAVYPADLHEPFVGRRIRTGRELYAAIGVAQDDVAGRQRQHQRNAEFFGAPLGLFFCIDRRLGPPQWADLGMYMQNVMLLAVERGLDTCPQEYWARHPKTVASFLELPDDLMLFSGMAMGYRDQNHPINHHRSFRTPPEAWRRMIGFD